MSFDLLEEQKRRESEWVQEGKERFLAHCEQTHARGSTSTPAGALVMRSAAKGFTKALNEFASEAAGSDRLRGDASLFLAIMALGADHVAAVTLHCAIQMCWRAYQAKGDDRTPKEILVTKARELGEVIEHDLRFRQFKMEAKQDGDDEAKRVIERMKKDMEGNRKSWKRRMDKLRALADEPWDYEFRAVIGLDLLGLLVKACPETFECPSVNFGGKTLRLFRLTEKAAEALTTSMDVAAVSQPRFGMMLVKPRPWRYAEG